MAATKLISENDRKDWRTPNVATAATTLTIKNISNRSIKYEWMDFKGSPIFYAVLHPQSTGRQPTYEGHVWRFLDNQNSKIYGYFVATPGNTTVILDVQKITQVATRLIPENERKDWRTPKVRTDATLMTIINKSSKVVYLQWMDFQGKSVLYSTIPSGQQVDQPTYVGHVWRFVDNEKVYGYFLATAGDWSVVFDGQNQIPAPPAPIEYICPKWNVRLPISGKADHEFAHSMSEEVKECPQSEPFPPLLRKASSLDEETKQAIALSMNALDCAQDFDINSAPRALHIDEIQSYTLQTQLDAEWMIWLCPFEVGDQLITLWWLDTFHKECINDCAKRDQRCPNCRQDVFII